MNDVVVVEAAHDVRNGVAFADVGEELVAEAFALARACNEAGDIDEFHCSGNNALRMIDFSELLQARIGNLNNADVGFNRAERIVFRRDAGLRKRVEDGGLADVGQADDAAFQTHGVYSSFLVGVIRAPEAVPEGDSF